MKILDKQKIYDKLYTCDLQDLDKNLSEFIKNKKIISKQNTNDPAEFEY